MPLRHAHRARNGVPVAVFRCSASKDEHTWDYLCAKADLSRSLPFMAFDPRSTIRGARQKPPDSTDSSIGDGELDRLYVVSSKESESASLLFRFGPSSVADFASALRQAIEQGDEIVAAEILLELSASSKRTSAWPEEVRSLASFASSADPRVRKWGVRIAGRLRLREAGAALVELLGDPDPEIGVEADEALTEITGKDLGFEPDLPPGEIERIREARRRSLSDSG